MSADHLFFVNERTRQFNQGKSLVIRFTDAGESIESFSYEPDLVKKMLESHGHNVHVVSRALTEQAG